MREWEYFERIEIISKWKNKKRLRELRRIWVSFENWENFERIGNWKLKEIWDYFEWAIYKKKNNILKN